MRSWSNHVFTFKRNGYNTQEPGSKSEGYQQGNNLTVYSTPTP